MCSVLFIVSPRTSAVTECPTGRRLSMRYSRGAQTHDGRHAVQYRRELGRTCRNNRRERRNIKNLFEVHQEARSLRRLFLNMSCN